MCASPTGAKLHFTCKRCTPSFVALFWGKRRLAHGWTQQCRMWVVVSFVTFVCRSREENYAIIREIYEDDSASEYFENELEQALDNEVNYIIIEPSKLGEETARWIKVGNCLHKTSVVTGLMGLSSGLVWPDRGLVYFPMCALSTVCAGVYMISWQFDPCCKYQVEYDTKRLQKLPLQKLTSSSPVVLMRRDDTRRKVLHSTVSLLGTAYCVWKLYDWYFKS